MGFEKIEKHEKFKKIAERRTNKIIDMIRVLGNCSNRNAYQYTESEVRQIFEAIEKEIKETKEKFLEKEQKGKRFILK